MKKHELAERALKRPELFTPAELTYFRVWLRSRQERKEQEKREKKAAESDYLK